MASLTAEIDQTEAHSAMRDWFGSAMGAVFTAIGRIGSPPLRAIHPEAWRSPLKRALVAQTQS